MILVLFWHFNLTLKYYLIGRFEFCVASLHEHCKSIVYDVWFVLLCYFSVIVPSSSTLVSEDFHILCLWLVSLCWYHCFERCMSYFSQRLQWTAPVTLLCLLLYSSCASLLHSLDMCPTVFCLSLHILHITSPCCSSVSTLIAFVLSVWSCAAVSFFLETTWCQPRLVLRVGNLLSFSQELSVSPSQPFRTFFVFVALSSFCWLTSMYLLRLCFSIYTASSMLVSSFLPFCGCIADRHLLLAVGCCTLSLFSLFPCLVSATSSSSFLQFIMPAAKLTNDTAYVLIASIVLFPFNFDHSTILARLRYSVLIFLFISSYLISSVSKTPKYLYRLSLMSWITCAFGRVSK